MRHSHARTMVQLIADAEKLASSQTIAKPNVMRCFQCGDDITADNNGMAINNGEFYQCNDCHLIEYGSQISVLLLIYK